MILEKKMTCLALLCDLIEKQSEQLVMKEDHILSFSLYSRKDSIPSAIQRDPIKMHPFWLELYIRN